MFEQILWGLWRKWFLGKISTQQIDSSRFFSSFETGIKLVIWLIKLSIRFFGFLALLLTCLCMESCGFVCEEFPKENQTQQKCNYLWLSIKLRNFLYTLLLFRCFFQSLYYPIKFSFRFFSIWVYLVKFLFVENLNL